MIAHAFCPKIQQNRTPEATYKKVVPSFGFVRRLFRFLLGSLLLACLELFSGGLRHASF
jgi:hypothetical protein